MKILSFDQSTKVTGWCLYDGKYVDSGIIDKHKIDDVNKRTGEMGIAICEKISDVKPDIVVIENVQAQAGVATVIMLARLQGIILGYNYANGVETKILAPTEWRSALSFKQGPKVKRKELKEQSINYVKEHLGFDFQEDQCEACCIAIAAQKMFENDADEGIDI